MFVYTLIAQTQCILYQSTYVKTYCKKSFHFIEFYLIPLKNFRSVRWIYGWRHLEIAWTRWAERHCKRIEYASDDLWYQFQHWTMSIFVFGTRHCAKKITFWSWTKQRPTSNLRYILFLTWQSVNFHRKLKFDFIYSFSVDTYLRVRILVYTHSTNDTWEMRQMHYVDDSPSIALNYWFGSCLWWWDAGRWSSDWFWFGINNTIGNNLTYSSQREQEFDQLLKSAKEMTWAYTRCRVCY